MVAAVAWRYGVAHDSAPSALIPSAKPVMAIPDLTKERSFDNVNLPRYANFWNEWHLVTTRFRRDNGEQRFIFANDIAWKTIRARTKVYRDGAMFGKVAFNVGDDESFPNSMEPRRFARIQLMKKDSKTYKTSDGWGYAILVGNGHPPYDSAVSTVAACHACHKLVPERDFVFSSPAFLGDGFAPDPIRGIGFKGRFGSQDIANLSIFQRQALRSLPPRAITTDNRAIKSAPMELFYGSINESIGVLSRFALRDSSVYALWDEPHGQFVIAEPMAPTAECAARAAFAFTAASGNRQAARRSPSPMLAAPPVTELGTTCNGALQR
jgi:hypothetical protein